MKLLKPILLLSIFFISFSSFAAKKKVKITASEQSAVIYANGQEMGVGSALVIVPAYSKLTVTVKAVGFLDAKKIFYNMPDNPKPPKIFHFSMVKDEAFEASESTDQANIDFSIVVNKNLSLTDAWRLSTQIVTDYFDVIEMSDKETSYLRTSWNVHSFQESTIRTRFFIKLGATEPLTFKIKIVSEISNKPGASAKNDELFREWDRLLRKYKNIITDFSSRLSEK